MFRRQPWATLFGLIGTAMVLALPARASDSHAIVTLVDRVETAYHGRDTAGLADARRQLLQLATESPAGSRAGYYAAHARFRQALGSSTTDEATAKSFLDDCITELTGYVAANPADAEARALLGSCYGMSTTHYPLGLVARGMEARKQLNMARDLAPANPWVLMQDGLVDFATPRMFGGSRTAAIAKLERAARLFAEAEAGGSSLAGWALIETWQQLALMYAATGQAEAAADASERAGSLPRSTARLRQASLQ